MRNEQEVLNASPFTSIPDDPFPSTLPHDRAIDRAQDPLPLEAPLPWSPAYLTNLPLRSRRRCSPQPTPSS